MMIDDDTLKQLLRINDELLQLCKWLNEKRDMATSSRLIPLVDDLTHILIEAGRTNYTDLAMHRHIRHDSIIPDAWAIRMIKFLTITFGVLLASSVSCRAGDSHHTGSRTDPQELLIQLVPDIPDLKVV